MKLGGYKNVVNNIKEVIAKAYNSLYPDYVIRDNETHSGSSGVPTFFVNPYNFEYHKVLGDIYTGILSFDDLFFSDSIQKESLRSDLLSMQEQIMNQFTKLDGYRATDQSCEIIDKVLHHKYKIKYRELRREDVDKINSILSSVNHK